MKIYNDDDESRAHKETKGYVVNYKNDAIGLIRINKYENIKNPAHFSPSRTILKLTAQDFCFRLSSLFSKQNKNKAL